MLRTVMKWLRRLIGSPPREPKPAPIALPDQSASGTGDQMAIFTDKHTGTIVPYDENLLERAKTQWQFGDWQSLAAIDHNGLEQHPDRAKLALLAAAGYAQVGDTANARRLFQLTEDWGCSKRLIAQVLIAGVHNSLGLAAASSGLEARALDHFKSSVTLGALTSDLKLCTQARADYQAAKMELMERSNLSIPSHVIQSTTFQPEATHSPLGT